MTTENAWINAGNMAISRREFDRAIFFYSMAIYEEPELVEAYLNRSKAYLMKGNILKSSEDKKTAFDIDPEFVIQFCQLRNYEPQTNIFRYDTIKQN